MQSPTREVIAQTCKMDCRRPRGENLTPVLLPSPAEVKRTRVSYFLREAGRFLQPIYLYRESELGEMEGKSFNEGAR